MSFWDMFLPSILLFIQPPLVLAALVPSGSFRENPICPLRKDLLLLGAQMSGKLCFEVVLGEKALTTTVFLFQVGLYATTLHFFIVV